MRQHLLIDADDTLWENNIYFEQAFHEFCEFLSHSTLTNPQIRAALDEIELANIRVNGYGAANFGRNMVECYHHLVERQISPSDAEYILHLAIRINQRPLEILPGVPDTLAYLSERHDLMLVTKGNHEEQQLKVDKSGLGQYFREVVIVREKDAAAYQGVVREHALPEEQCWMVGNSPKSDINPALEAGIGAVYVPHPRTWHLEHQALREGDRLLVIDSFGALREHF